MGANNSRGPGQHLDTETASLIAQLQKEDAENLVSHKDEQKEGGLTDAEIAMQLHLEDLGSLESTAIDHSMALSMASAVSADDTLLQEMSAHNDQALQDHELALRLNNEPNRELNGLPAIAEAAGYEDAPQPEWDDLTMAKICARQAFFLKEKEQGTFYSEADAQADPSHSAALRKPAEVEEMIQCAACTGNRVWFETVKAPCGDDYCEDCISDLFEQSMDDETLYPPRCCRQPIPLKSTSVFLRPGLFEAFSKKKVELDTSNRIYCHEPTCNVFIPSSRIEDDLATCPECQRNTCTMCRNASHDGDCPGDVALQQVLQLAQEAGWQRCNNCHRLVELNTGCYHMTCHCGAQFCYVCGQRWKTCACPQWEERRLLNRAEQIIDRQLGIAAPQAADAPEHVPIPVEAVPRPPPDPAARVRDLQQVQDLRQVRIREMADHLRTNHECEHLSWTYVTGSHQCEECRDTLPRYIFNCDQCHIRACWRCRQNRL